MELALTKDLDAVSNFHFTLENKLNEILKEHGLHLDPDLISKALKAPEKNRNILIEYLAKNPTDNFFMLAEKYKVNLESFV